MYSMYVFVCVRIIHTYVLCMYVCMYVCIYISPFGRYTWIESFVLDTEGEA